MRKGLIIAVVALFFPARICLANESSTIIQLSMGLVIIGGAVLFRSGFWGLEKLRKKRKERTDDTKKKKDL